MFRLLFCVFLVLCGVFMQASALHDTDYYTVCNEPSTYPNSDPGNIAGMIKPISSKEGNYGNFDKDITASLVEYWGNDVATLGDVNGDSITDLAVGDSWAANAAGDHAVGAVYILFLDSDRNVGSYTQIDGDVGGLVEAGVQVLQNDAFGKSVVAIGDLDGDNVPDVAATALQYTPVSVTSQAWSGALIIMLLNADGTVSSATTIGEQLVPDCFSVGYGLEALGKNVLSHGKMVIAMGQAGLETYDTNGIYFVSVNDDGSFYDQDWLQFDDAVFEGNITFDSGFARYMAYLGDVKNDGGFVMAMGMPETCFTNPENGLCYTDRGAIWIVSFDVTDDMIVASSAYKIDTLEDPYDGSALLVNGFIEDIEFGGDITSIGDLDGDGVNEILVAASRYPNGQGPGALYVISLEAVTADVHYFDIITVDSNVMPSDTYFGEVLELYGYDDMDQPIIVVGVPNDHYIMSFPLTKCDCPVGGVITGKHCENECLNGGTKNSVDGCDCSGTMYTGNYCEVSCNNGTNAGSDMCDCTDAMPSVTGQYCDIPCLNDGTSGNSENCTCDGTGYQGAVCDVDVDECAEGIDMCNNVYNATDVCVNTDGSYTCTCSDAFTGDLCEVDIDDCASSPCYNEGTCIDQVGGWECDCPSNWDGVDCNTDADECTDGTAQCYGDAECFNIQFGGGYYCNCTLTPYDNEFCTPDDWAPTSSGSFSVSDTSYVPSSSLSIISTSDEPITIAAPAIAPHLFMFCLSLIFYIALI